jgi:hypothetical protein
MKNDAAWEIEQIDQAIKYHKNARKKIKSLPVNDIVSNLTNIKLHLLEEQDNELEDPYFGDGWTKESV